MQYKKFSSANALPSSKMHPIFRSQAMEHVGVRQYGNVILAQPVAYSVLTMLFLFVAAAIVVFIFTFSTTRKAQCQGVILPNTGLVRIVATQTGIIKELKIKEGQVVKSGDVLFVLSSERFNSESVGAQRKISTLLRNRKESLDDELGQSSKQAKQRRTAIDGRIENLTTEILRLDDQVSLQKQRVTLSERTLGRFSDLQATNYISAAQLQDKQADLLDQRQRLADLERSKAVSKRDLATAQGDLQDLQFQSQREASAIQRNIFELEQSLTDSESRRELFIRAPQDGVVSAITAELGQTISSNQSLASILPTNAELEAEIYATSRSAGFIQPGMKVLIRFQAYPYQKFGQYSADVREMSNTSIRSDDLPIPSAALTSGAASEPLYRIRLKLNKQTVQAYGKSVPLKSGMLVDASVQLEERRLYEWILEPLYSISGRN